MGGLTGQWGADKIDPTLGNDRYPNNLDTRMIYGPFDLSDATLAHVNFWLWREVEANRDCLLFEASPDGVTFYTVRSWCDSDPNWRAYNEITFNGYGGDPSVWIAWRFYSDSSVTYQGPWLDDLELRKFVPGQITVQGSFAYADRAGQSQPARFMKAYLYDADPGGTDDLLAQTTTITNGTFVFPALRNWDIDNPDQTSTTGHLDLYVVWKTEFNDSQITQRRVTNFGGVVYPYNSSTQPDVLDGMVYFNNYFVPTNDPKQRAMWIFQDLRQGWDYVRTATGSDPGSVSAHWEKDQNSYLTCGLSCFNPLFGLFIGHDDAVSPDIVVHELGHQYMYNTRGFWISICGAHHMFDVSDQICAWAEGWADFFPLVVSPLGVNIDTCFDWGLGPCGAGGGAFENLETQNPSDLRPTGDTVEGRVAGALYDLYDGTSDGLDHVGYGFDEIWTLMSTGAAENSFVDFWNNWKSSTYPQHWAVQAIFQNTIDYDVAPIIQLPDVTVFKDMVIDHVLDLWNYSSDPESADTDLSWSIVGMSNGNCGVAAQGHYIATAPLAGFLGNCDITVRVSDGLKTSDDELNVRVVEVQARSFLPLILKNMTNPLQSPLVSPSPFASPLPVPVQPNPFVSPLPNPITP